MNVYRLIICSFIAICLSMTADARTYLVSVGISDYPGTRNDLHLPVNDATAMKIIYSKNSDAETVLLTNANATKSAILSALRQTFSKASDNDIIVFFFSGHGCPGAFCAHDNTLPYADIREVMAASKAKNKMIFADACFSGKMRQGRQNGGQQSFSKYNILLFLSSRSEETSIERGGMKNGFFTSCLQKGLRGGADKNKDRIITAKELFTYVRNGVRNLSCDKQHPVMWGKFDDNMPVIKW